ncbi:hypothetical protein ACFVVP_39030 [Streptomyces sp. NPDC058128]|uniref:hypothetical protein n=1 Tax=Streptomyces sp. NPDC058128 TaxID=3346352 RepID=UPI0036EEBDFD
MTITRPGQVVVLDTTPFLVKLRDDVFGEPITVDLTLALDAFTHSMVAFRLTPGSDASIEVAMLLRDVMLPLPMRPDWTPDMEGHYPGVPAALVAEFAGHPVAGRPFFAPETVTSDHGSVYKNHHLVQVARTLGKVVLPARTMRPQDKAACERTFWGIQSLLLELLLGYRGIEVADRGIDPEGDAVWTVDEAEHLLAEWTVRIWQNRRLDQYAPAWDPGGRHGPNTLFAMAAARDGIALQIPDPTPYHHLLPAHFVKLHGRRGVKIGGLWYGGDHPVLSELGSLPSPRSGRHRGKWVVHRDPRDCRQVFIELAGQWHTLPWNGLPTGEDVLAFSDPRVQQVLREAARAGLTPQRHRTPARPARPDRRPHPGRLLAEPDDQGRAGRAGPRGRPRPGRRTRPHRPDDAAGRTAAGRARPPEPAGRRYRTPPPSRAGSGRPVCPAGPSRRGPARAFAVRASRRRRRSRTGTGGTAVINGEESLPFVLSGPAPARDTVAGWQHWCRTRNSFAPAPVMDRAAFGPLSKRKKMLHNLHRTATHANLPLLDTPMSLAVEKLLTGRIEPTR